jgi:cytochrome c-type biogenesis protein CcmF
VIFWGTFFPLISEAFTGEEASVGPPWFSRYATPLALVLVLLSGIGPVLAWRRVTWKNLRRALVVPLGLVLVALAAMLALTPAAESVTSLLMFSFVTLVLGVVSQEFWRGTRARRAMSGERWPAALASLVGRNRRRYGGYLVHAGIALLFLGVAASSAFVDQRDVRLVPGQTTTVGDYTITYREPIARVQDDRAGTGAPLTLGAALVVEKEGRRFELEPSRNYYGGGANANPDAPIRGFFEGEATSEVDVRWGLIRDVWVAVQPDLRTLETPIREADERFADLGGDVGGLLVAALAERFTNTASPVNVRALVSPLVVWIWIGGGVVVLGALIALWPARPRGALSGLYAARVGRDVREPVRA